MGTMCTACGNDYDLHSSIEKSQCAAIGGIQDRLAMIDRKPAAPVPIEPVKCRCGKTPLMTASHVYCPGCWCGPLRTTRDAAVAAWNEVMGHVCFKQPPNPLK